MISCKVIGTAASTVKHPTLVGQKMLVVRTDTEPYIAVDYLGAGIGDTVLITSDSGIAVELVKTKATPIRWSVIGVIDH